MIKAFALHFVRFSLPLTFADLLGSKLPFVRGVLGRTPLPSLGIFALVPAAGRGSQVIVAGREGNRFFLPSLPATGERDAPGPAPIGRGGPPPPRSIPVSGSSRPASSLLRWWTAAAIPLCWTWGPVLHWLGCSRWSQNRKGSHLPLPVNFNTELPPPPLRERNGSIFGSCQNLFSSLPLGDG